jgi:hypothetical protein
MAKGNQKVTVELERAIRAEMSRSIVAIWAQCGTLARCVRIQVTLANGQTFGQRREIKP